MLFPPEQEKVIIGQFLVIMDNSGFRKLLLKYSYKMQLSIVAYIQEVIFMKQKLLEGKKSGFYVTLVLIALSIVMAIVYAVLYRSSSYMSWRAFAAILVGAVLALGLGFTKLAKWSNAVVALGDFLGLLLYIYAIYFYVSSIMVGIQGSRFSWQFLVVTVGLAVLFVLNLVNVFLKQVKED